MAKVSSGLLMYRIRNGKPQVLLAHPGGPIFRNKDAGAWTIPKGELAEGEDRLAAAQREFAEEIGVPAAGPFVPLQPVTQKSGKVVHAWAVQGDLDVRSVKSNTFSIEWPPKSGKISRFPEVDRAEFFDLDTAKLKINPAQVAFLDELEKLLDRPD